MRDWAGEAAADGAAVVGVGAVEAAGSDPDEAMAPETTPAASAEAATISETRITGPPP